MPIEEYKKKKTKNTVPKLKYRFHSQAKYDRFKRYKFHRGGMYFLACILMFLAAFITGMVYLLYNQGLLKTIYSKYERYAIMVLTFGSLATASIFSGMEATKADNQMKKILEEDKAERPSLKTI